MSARASFGRALLACASATLAACQSDPHALRWQISFSDRALRERAAVIEARIAKGGCKSDDLVYLSHFDPDAPGSLPPSLEPGRYGFVARAQDRACRWFAAGCSELSLPRSSSAPLSVQMSALSDEALDCDGPACHALNCGSAASPDAGAGDEDAGDESARDAGPPPVMLGFEAEAAKELRAPLERSNDDAASGRTYISYPVDPMQTLEQQQAQKRSTPPSSDSDGIAVYDFALPRADHYRMWGRVIAANVDSDSFWIQIDDRPFIQWNDIGHGDSWLWVDVRDFEKRTEPYAFELGAGSHVLRISYRELDTKLDKLLFSSDLDFIPSD